jgi:hydroxymethylpyrimidine/phosphomethylpyrimidine kinase
MTRKDPEIYAMKTVLTIAGSDPTGGAGLQADLKVFRYFDVYGLSVISAVTAQNTVGVDAVYPVDREAFEKQLRTLCSDIRPDAVKIGMLYSTWAVDLLAGLFSGKEYRNIVIDPVTISSSGMSLVDEGTLDLIRVSLFPLSRVITPNIYEATVLTGVMIEDKRGMEEAARSLKSMGPEVVVITGGHLEGKAADLYFDGTFHVVEGERIKGEYHGTGCAFSSAVTALLALGYTPLESVRKAKEYVREAMEKACHPGRGMGLLNL